jgi:hypothetical protein
MIWKTERRNGKMSKMNAPTVTLLEEIKQTEEALYNTIMSHRDGRTKRDQLLLDLCVMIKAWSKLVGPCEEDSAELLETKKRMIYTSSGVMSNLIPIILNYGGR